MGLQRTALQQRGIDLFTTRPVPVRFSKYEADAARSLIAERCKRGIWGFKDPRTCLFLDEWERLLDCATFLFIVRHPCQSVDSLVRRNMDRHVVNDPLIGIRSWIVYNQAILQFVQQYTDRCVVIELEILLGNPQQLIAHLNKAFDTSLKPEPLDDVFEHRRLNRKTSGTLDEARDRASESFDQAFKLYQALCHLPAASIWQNTVECRPRWRRPVVAT